MTRGVWVLTGVLALGCGGAGAFVLGLPPASPPPPVASPGTQGAGARRGPTPDLHSVPAIELIRNRDSVLALLPRDAAGSVDWVKARRTGVIRPRASASGSDSGRGGTFEFDFFIPGGLEAYFPHSAHTEWLSCQSCHPAIFRYPRDTTVTMEVINQGKACGVCHGTVAFPRTTCERCHPDLAGSSTPAAATLADDVVIARPDSARGLGTSTYPPAHFSNAVHRIRYRCAACHPTLFPMQAGAGALSMSAMQAGAGCGACHDGAAAFSLVTCVRCHDQRPGPRGAT